MAQAFVAACVTFMVGWVGFGVALAHAPADSLGVQVATSQHLQHTAV